MEAADKNIPLDLNAFVLKKAIHVMANAEPDNVKPMSLYWSRDKATMQKSPEDNQAIGIFTCQSFTT